MSDRSLPTILKLILNYMKKIFTFCAALVAGASFINADEIIVNFNGKQVQNGETVTVSTLEQAIFDPEFPEYGWEKFQIEAEECGMTVKSDAGGTLTSEMIYVSDDLADQSTSIQCCGKFFGSCYTVSSGRNTTGEITYPLAAGENDLSQPLPGSKNGLQLEWQLSSLPSVGWESYIKEGDSAEVKMKFSTGNTSLEFNVRFVYTTGNAAVEGINASDDAPFTIYGIDGSVVRRNAVDTLGLDRGLYIVKGKKVLVK